MFDIGWSEMLIIGVVALIVVGPKDLPKMFQTLGQTVGKMRGLAREFQSAMNAAAKESGMGDIARDVQNLRSGKTIRDAVGFDEIDKEFEAIRKPARAPITPGPGTKKAAPVPTEPLEDEADDDGAAVAAAYDADVAKRNAKIAETETLRLKKQAQTERMRQEAARLRAQRETDVPTASDTQDGGDTDRNDPPPSSKA